MWWVLSFIDEAPCAAPGPAAHAARTARRACSPRDRFRSRVDRPAVQPGAGFAGGGRATPPPACL